MIKSHLILNGHQIFLELSFSSIEIREACLSKDVAIREYGELLAEVLINRLADIRAASSPCDLFVGNPHPVELNSEQYYAISLSEDESLIFSANHKGLGGVDSHSIDWSRIYRIKIIHIGKSHEFKC
jgi:hypothetical protein